MKSFASTFMAGVLFLLPITAIAFLATEAFDIALLATEPAADFFGAEDVAGVAASSLLAAALLAAVCWGAGKLSTSAAVGGLFAPVDRAMMEALPGYMLIKTMFSPIATAAEESVGLRPVRYVAFNVSHIAFEVERSDDGYVVLFLPGAPVPWSGSVIVVDAATVTPMDASGGKALGSLMKLGRGASDLMRPGPRVAPGARRGGA